MPTLLAKIVGHTAALALVEAYAGQRIYIPRKPRKHYRLAQVISMPAFAMLAAARGGEYFKVPLCRAERIVAYRARGMSYPAIARAVQCSEGTVGDVLRSAGLTRPRRAAKGKGNSQSIIAARNGASIQHQEA